MSLAAVKSQINALGKRLDVMDGAGDAIHYLWTRLHSDGEKEIMAGNIHSRANQVVEIQCRDADGAGSAPRILVDGKERVVSHTAPGLSIDEVLHHA